MPVEHIETPLEFVERVLPCPRCPRIGNLTVGHLNTADSGCLAYARADLAAAIEQREREAVKRLQAGWALQRHTVDAILAALGLEAK